MTAEENLAGNNGSHSDVGDEEICSYGGCGHPEGQCPACLGIV